MNMIMFTPKKISGGKADAKSIGFETMNNWGAKPICLPIPTGINATYQQSWTAATVEGRNSMLVDKGGTLLKQLATSLTPGTVGGRADREGPLRAGTTIADVLDKLTEGFDAGRVWDATIGNVSSADFWNETAGGVATELAAMVAAGPAEGLATAAQYTVGMRALKQTMMSYGGPGFRSFNYNFSLKPFSIAESRVVDQIIDLLKSLSAPKQHATRYTRVYDLPAVFKIQFFNGASENQWLSKIGHCALTNLSITYGGGKFSTFSGSHAPTQVDLVLQFQEMELLDADMMRAEGFASGVWPQNTSDGSTNVGAITTSSGETEFMST